MSNLVIHLLDSAWTSSNPAALQVTVDSTTFEGPVTASNLLVANDAANGESASFQPAAPLDLSGFDELVFWIMGDRAAEGMPGAPFLLEFSYTDAGDLPGEEHRWYVPVNQANAWEQRRIGIANDRRSAVNRFRFRRITSVPQVCRLNELLAVNEEMLLDAERSMTGLLDNQIKLPGLSGIPLKQTAIVGATQIVLPLMPSIAVNNRLEVSDGGANRELHLVAAVVHDSGANTSTITFPAGETAQHLLTA